MYTTTSPEMHELPHTDYLPTASTNTINVARTSRFASSGPRVSKISPAFPAACGNAVCAAAVSLRVCVRASGTLWCESVCGNSRSEARTHWHRSKYQFPSAAAVQCVARLQVAARAAGWEAAVQDTDMLTSLLHPVDRGTVQSLDS
jgi:hypothetical protein